MDPVRKSQLIRLRAVAKSSLTRMKTFIGKGDCKVNEVQVRYDELPIIYNKFESAQGQLELEDDNDYTVDRQQFGEQYFEVKAKFNELLHPVVDSPPRSRRSSHRNSNSGRSNNSPRSHNSSSYIKLPSIALPTFSGNTCDWLHYRDTFEALVNNSTLSSVQKFHYLIASLQNEAKALISNLQITNENFLVAWHLVTQRYNNKRLIAMTHIRSLSQMPQVIKGDAASLRKLLNHVTSHMSALQALSFKATFQDLMLNRLMLATLDPELQREWEVVIAGRTDTPVTSELVTFLEARCRALELIQPMQSQRAGPSATRSSQSTGTSKVSKPSRSYVTTQMQCSLCNGSHRLFKCDKFKGMQPRQRHSHVKRHSLCFNCLQPFTKNHTCSNQMCRLCHKRHHSLLHLDKPEQSTNNKGSVNTTTSVESRGDHNTEVNTYCSVKTYPNNHTLLATAIVEVQNKAGHYVPCRALLDSASQCHFITERCVQRLNLSKLQTRVSIQGISNISTSTRQSVSIHMRSRHTPWHDNLNCTILTNITGPTPTMKLDISKWNLPKDIKLADEQFNIPNGIDLLLGADLFFEVLRSDRRTRRGYPVLQDTELGWTISGRTPAVKTE